MPQTCARGAEGVGGELSSPNAPKAQTQGLPDPPSQLSVEEEEEERKRERLVPETAHQGGRSHSPVGSLQHAQHWGFWAPKNTHCLDMGGPQAQLLPTRVSGFTKLPATATLTSGSLGGLGWQGQPLHHHLQPGRRPGVLQGVR